MADPAPIPAPLPMEDKVALYNLYAFFAILAAIVFLYLIGAILAFNGKSAEALGLTGAGTGLIGLAGSFRPSTRVSGTSIGPVGKIDQAG